MKTELPPSPSVDHQAIENNIAVMNVETHLQISGDVAVLHCCGEITANPSGHAFRAMVTGLLRQYRKVIIDLARVHYIDSSGLGILVGLYSAAHSARSVLKYRNLDTTVDYTPNSKSGSMAWLKQAS